MIRLPLASYAKETERSKSSHIQKAIEFYIKEQVDLQISLDRLNNAKDEIISLSEMREKLEI